MSATTKPRSAAKKATKKRVAKGAKKSAAKKSAAKKGAKRAAAKKATKKPAKRASKRTSKKTASRSAARRGPAKKRASSKTGRKPGNRAQIGARNLTARTAEVKAARRQRRKSVIVVLIALSAAAAAGITAIRSPFLDVDSVSVRGADAVAVDEILAAASVPMGSPLVDLPAEAITDRVESIPAIRTATVTRHLDGTVQIEVTEREPTMALRSNGGFVLVDDDGRQVRASDVAPDGFLPVIGLEATGVPGDPAPPGSTAVLRLMDEITPPVRAAVTDVIVTGDQLALRLAEGGRAILGDDDQLAAKVVSLETLLLSVDMRCVHEIDLTVPSAPALSRIGEKGNPRDGLADLTECS
ncbi:MAG: FtsQ-type POTRA domain-containing protein [Acidimicrobiales bacterium]|nr:FtsQ-type POTRA domain-containing protein [Acidimicrobiales bacterium]